MPERATIVSWKSDRGRIRADNGDILILFYWSVLKGFRELAPGRRVKFSRGAGLRRNAADLVMAVSEPAKGLALDIPAGMALGWLCCFAALRAAGPLCGDATSTKFAFGAA